MVYSTIGIKLPNERFIPLLKDGIGSKRRLHLNFEHLPSPVTIKLYRVEDSSFQNELYLGYVQVEIDHLPKNSEGQILLEFLWSEDNSIAVYAVDEATSQKETIQHIDTEESIPDSDIEKYGHFEMHTPVSSSVAVKETDEKKEVAIESLVEDGYVEEFTDYITGEKVLVHEKEEDEDEVRLRKKIYGEKEDDIEELVEEDDFDSYIESPFKTKHTIRGKLLLIISSLVVLSLGLITFLVSFYISKDVRINAENNNRAINSRIASDVKNQLETLQKSVLTMLDMIDIASNPEIISQQATFFFERNDDFAAIIIPSKKRLINSRFFAVRELEESMIDDFFTSNEENFQKALAGQSLALNASPFFGYPMTAILYPYYKKDEHSLLIILVSAEKMCETLDSDSVNSSYVVNDKGVVLAHSDMQNVLSAVNFEDDILVQDLRNNAADNRQLLYTNDEGFELFGAYKKLSFAGVSVITSVKSSVVLAAVNSTTKRNIFLTIAVLAFTILIVWIFAQSISNPIKAVAAAANEIKEGKFDINLEPRTHDEVGRLTEGIVAMGQGLKERETLKDTFGRFINEEIAEKALRGELTLGGEKKEATIFFSDIRSFTAISEKMEPEEVVGFLNEYMTRMVKCVKQTGGVVDKFIGDAVMGVWGAPVSSGDKQTDAINCVRTALMMRASLIEFNEGRGGEKKPIIRIGCGINTGPVVAGQIGSEERMEYTVIGDAVNFASRTESLNKPLGTDILITENTYEIVKDFVTVEEQPSVTVKGKEKPVRMFAVLNMPGATDIDGAGVNGPSSIDDVRDVVGIPKPDLTGVNLDQEEKKYKIEDK